MKIAILMLLTMLGAIGAGCMSDYQHAVVNIGNHTLYGVKLRAGDHVFDPGKLLSGCKTGILSEKKLIRKSPTPVVCWRNSMFGPDICQEVELDSAPGRGKMLYFILDGETVRATYTLPPLPKIQPYKPDPTDDGWCVVIKDYCTAHGDDCPRREEHIQDWQRAQNPPPVEYRKDPNAERTP